MRSWIMSWVFLWKVKKAARKRLRQQIADGHLIAVLEDEERQEAIRRIRDEIDAIGEETP